MCIGIFFDTIIVGGFFFNVSVIPIKYCSFHEQYHLYNMNCTFRDFAQLCIMKAYLSSQLMCTFIIPRILCYIYI